LQVATFDTVVPFCWFTSEYPVHIIFHSLVEARQTITANSAKGPIVAVPKCEASLFTLHLKLAVKEVPVEPQRDMGRRGATDSASL